MEQLANMPMWAQVFSMGSFMFASGVLLLRLPLLPTLILSFIYLLNIFGAGTTMPSFTFKSPWIWTIGHAVLLIPLGFVFICIAANSSSSSKSAEMWNSAFFYLFFIGMLIITIIPAIYKLVILFKELPFGAGVTAVCVFFLILGLAVSIKFFKPMAAEGGILFGFFIPTIFAAVICVIALAGIFTRNNILCFIAMAVCMILLYITSIMSGASRPAAVPPLINAVEKNNPQKVKTILESSKISSQDITDAFIKAVELGNAQIVKDLIAVGADVEAQNKYGYTPLSVASKKGQMEIVQILLDAGADITAQNKNGTCALSEASQNGQVRTVKMLLLKGVSDSQKDAALEAAASSDTYGCKEIVEILVKAGASAKDSNALFKMNKGYNSDEKIVEQLLLTAKADPNAKTEGGKTVLMDAAGAWGANPEILKKLLDAGADVNAKDDEGNTALIYTIKRYLNPKNVKVLLEAGANPNVTDNEGNTPLFLVMKANCAEYEKTESIRALIEKGATPDIANNDGITPLMSASQHNDEDIVRLLIPATTDINAKDKNGNTALTYVYNAESAKLLINAGANVNIANNEGNTALNEAAYEDKEEVVNVLIAAGASKEVKNQALRTASKKGRNKIVGILLAAGADVNAKNIDGNTPLWYAYTFDNSYTEETMDILMAAGADINARDNAGNTIIIPTKDYFSINLKKLQKLLDAGIDLNAKNNDGNTALMSASMHDRNSDTAMVDMLLSYGAHVNAQNSNGDTALMLAVRSSAASKPAKVKRLLAGGADVTIKNKNGETALMQAYNAEIIKLLKNAGAKE